jgi:hypothetical protein
MGCIDHHFVHIYGKSKVKKMLYLLMKSLNIAHYLVRNTAHAFYASYLTRLTPALVSCFEMETRARLALTPKLVN